MHHCRGYSNRVGVTDVTIETTLTKSRAKSPWVCHMNAGSCNGCDIEILAALTPRYDVERFGITLHGSPRHSDVMLCTGPVTREVAPRLRRIYEQMSDPKFVIAIGSCAATGGVYQETYNILGGVDKVIPVNMYVPGCPPRPEAIIFGAYQVIVALLNSVAKSAHEKAVEEEQKEVEA